VLDEHDRPVVSFLIPGSTSDISMLRPMIAGFRTRLGIERACVIADRGTISASTIEALEAKGVDYTLGVLKCATGEVRETVLDDDGVAIQLTISRRCAQGPSWSH